MRHYAAEDGDSCADGEVCAAGLACVEDACVDVSAIEDDDARAAAAAAAVAEQSYGFGLACAVSGDATSESPQVELDGAFAIDAGVLSLEGEFHAAIPCGEDDYASAEVRVSLDLSVLKINDLAVGMKMYCAPPAADAQKYLVYGRLENIEVGFFSMGPVDMEISSTYKFDSPDEDEDEDEDEEQSGLGQLGKHGNTANMGGGKKTTTAKKKPTGTTKATDKSKATDTETDTDTDTETSTATATAKDTDRSKEVYYNGTITGTIPGIIEGLDVSASVSFVYGSDGRDDLDDHTTVSIDVSYTKKISGNVLLELTGHGMIKFPCEEVGDFAVGGSATVSGLKLFGNVLILHGEATYENNCGPRWRVHIILSIDTLVGRCNLNTIKTCVIESALGLRNQSTRLKLNGDDLLSNFAFNINMRRYALDPRGMEVFPSIYIKLPKLDLRMQSLSPGQLDIGLQQPLGRAVHDARVTSRVQSAMFSALETNMINLFQGLLSN